LILAAPPAKTRGGCARPGNVVVACA